MIIHSLERDIGEKVVITTASGEQVLIEVLGNDLFGVSAPDGIKC